MINLILQGGKTLTIGGQAYRYDPAHYFVMSIDVPATGTVHPDRDGQPYLAVALTLDPDVLADLLDELPTPAPGTHAERGFSICPMTPELLDAWLRLLRLIEHPGDIPALAPVYEREILYRVLQGPQGWMLREIALPDSMLSRIRRTIAWLRAYHDRPVQVETLADLAAMSPATFHRHFKAITAMSPIQFQKQLRLLRARQLLMTGARTASDVAYRVGYESPSQFSRDYARLFGASPLRDAMRLRKELLI
jgi:AraC-like DNA-binding protein